MFINIAETANVHVTLKLKFSEITFLQSPVGMAGPLHASVTYCTSVLHFWPFSPLRIRGLLLHIGVTSLSFHFLL